MSKNNGLGTMNIGGKDRPFHVQSTRQTDKFTETLGIELDDYWAMMSKLSDGKTLSSIKITIVFIWSALYAGAIKTDRRCDFTYNDVIDWVEDAESEEETAAELLKPLVLFADMVTEAKKKLDDKAKAND